MREVWPGTFVEPNNLAFNISLLRKALGDDDAAPLYIETVPKRGYRFIGALSETEAESEATPSEPALDPSPTPVSKANSRVRTGVIAGVVGLLGFGAGLALRRSDRPVQAGSSPDSH